MDSKLNKILIFAPHTDDGEFGAGGSIAKWLKFGHEIYYIAFSAPLGCLRREMMLATKTLGIPSANIILFDYSTRNFPAFRQEILEEMIRLRDGINPDLVVLPSGADTHQDHAVIASEGFRAFKRASIIGYEIPYNNKQFNANLFIPLAEEQINLKIKAIQHYKSQFGRIQDTDDFIRSLAVMRGAQIGVKYAEAFSVERWIYRLSQSRSRKL